MICNWCWFIQPATAITTNRNGSRTLGICCSIIASITPAAQSQRKFKQIQFPGHTGAAIWVVARAINNLDKFLHRAPE